MDNQNSVGTTNNEIKPEILLKEKSSVVNIIEAIVQQFNRFLLFVAGLSIIFMMAITVYSVIIREFTRPLSGISELTGWLAAISFSFALGYTQLEKGHVDIDILVNKFNKKVQKVTSLLVYSVSMFFFAMVGWQLIIYGNSVMKTNVKSATMEIAYYPFIYLVAIGFIGITLALLLDIVKLFLKRSE